MAAVAVVLFATHSDVVVAQKRPLLKPLDTKDANWEQWRTTVLVSGSVRAGVMSDTPGTYDSRAQSMTVFVPRGIAPLLCIDVTARDGRYTGTREYDVRGVSGPVDLLLPSRYAGELTKYAPGELAILARLAERCDGPSKSLVVASWQNELPGRTVSVFLNSRLPTTIVAGSSNRIEYEVRCTDLPEPTIAYNLRCDVPSAWLAPGPERPSLFVRTRRGGGFTTLSLEIVLQ